MLAGARSSGSASLDDLLGGVLPGDNVVWLGPRDIAYQHVEQAFLQVAAAAGPTLLIATSTTAVERPLPNGVERLDATRRSTVARPVALADEIDRRLTTAPSPPGSTTFIVVDDFDELIRRWGADDALAFFVRTCPSMLQAGAITLWRFARDHGAALVEPIRQVTQCLLERRGEHLHVLKAESRPASVTGGVHRLTIVDDEMHISHHSTAGRLARGIAAVRADHGLTQAQLADLAGVTPSAISQAESGARGLSIDTVITIADRLGISVDRLVSARPSPGYRLARHDRGRIGGNGSSRGDGIIALADDATVGLRAYFVLLAPYERGAPPRVHQGIELVAVARGLVQVTAGDDTPVLRAGDTLLADTATIGEWRNLRPEPAAFYWVLRD